MIEKCIQEHICDIHKIAKVPNRKNISTRSDPKWDLKDQNSFFSKQNSYKKSQKTKHEQHQQGLPKKNTELPRHSDVLMESPKHNSNSSNNNSNFLLFKFLTYHGI